MAQDDLPVDVREVLERMARSGDRGPPAVFAGRSAEFDLFESAVTGTARREPGRTVVVQGVPGAGKTALLNEYVERLSVNTMTSRQPTVVPVPLQSDDLDASPTAIVEEVDKQFRDFEEADSRKARMNRAASGAAFVGRALFASLTKKDFSDFRSSARAPNSLPVALDDYVAFRTDRRDSIIVLLVDEAQNFNNTKQVRSHLRALHSGVRGHARVLLVCFGLQATIDRLRDLGLSRIATDHTRTIGPLSNEEALQTVTGTLDVALSGFTFDQGSFDGIRRERWIGAAAQAILAESANFPHHLANGCRAFAALALAEGIADEPPIEKLREKCREHRKDYYNVRLRPWATHTTALALGFTSIQSTDGWTSATHLTRALMASDELGNPVSQETATAVLKEMWDNGYIKVRAGMCRPALPSLSSHFKSVRDTLPPRNEVASTVQAALAAHGESQTHDSAR